MSSADGFEVELDDEASPMGAELGAGVPDRGDAEDSPVGEAVGRPSGSAECWRFSCHLISM